MVYYFYFIFHEGAERGTGEFWNAWPFFIFFTGIFVAGWLYLTSRKQVYYIGARWIIEKYEVLGDGESRTVLNMYELSKIKLDRAPRPDATLLMVDHKKKSLEPPLGLLEGNPKLWDFVYNGLVHSAANGADVDPITRSLLHLPGPGATP